MINSSTDYSMGPYSDTEPEKKVEQRLINRVKERGGTSYKFVSPSRRGVPDRLIIMPGNRIIFVEVKRAGGVATKAQAREHTRLRDLGCECYVVAGIEEVELFVKEFLS